MARADTQPDGIVFAAGDKVYSQLQGQVGIVRSKAPASTPFGTLSYVVEFANGRAVWCHESDLRRA